LGLKDYIDGKIPHFELHPGVIESEVDVMYSPFSVHIGLERHRTIRLTCRSTPHRLHLGQIDSRPAGSINGPDWFGHRLNLGL
jgi:hypothetical protein